MTKAQPLKQAELFAGLDDAYLELLAPSCRERTFAAGDVLVEQGTEGIGLIAIVEGTVKVVKETGGASIEVATHGPGDVIGEMAVLDGAPRSASVIAETDCECLVLPSFVFRAALETHPQIALAILPVVVRRFRETNAQLAALRD